MTGGGLAAYPRAMRSTALEARSVRWFFATLALAAFAGCAPIEGAEGTDEEPEATEEQSTEQAVVWEYLGPAGVTRARSGETLALGDTNVRLPDDALTGESLQRSAFSAQLVPLRSPAAWMTEDGPVRSSRATTVRVVLDRIESLRPGLVAANTLSLLGDPERVTLVEGDRVEINVWAGNYTGAGDAVILGVSLGGRAVGDVLSDVRVGPATGGGAVRTTINPGVVKRGAYFAQRLGAGQHGGFALSGTVRRPPSGAAWALDLQAVAAFSGQTLTRDMPVSVERAVSVYQAQGLAARTHQQGQFYGWYEGEAVATAGQNLSVAAPGSWGYHGTSYESASAEAREAAYWVPLRVRLRAGASAPRSFEVVTATGQWVDPNAVDVQARAPGRPFARVAAGTSTRFVDGMDLQVTFLGTSATELGLRFR